MSDTTRALVKYMRLRGRRERLGKLPPDTKAVKYERFTAAEAEQLRIAEAQINRLNGVAAIELLIASRGSVWHLIT